MSARDARTSAASPPARLKELAALAVVGADRAGKSAGGAAGLLADAARVGAMARAGWRAPSANGMLPACPADPRPAAGRGATAILERLLLAPDAALLDEWAELANRRGQRVADALAPGLLDWWARQPQRSEALFAAIGKRAQWLASLNPDWKKPVAVNEDPRDADERWQTAAAAERTALLTTVRRADPKRALLLVQSTWASDGADERRRFVDVLNERRSMDDEPFLEAALDDKSKLVRRSAADVLSRLGDSRFKQRMNERARAMIAVEKKKSLLGRQKVKVALAPPEAFDQAWERDGIEEQAASGKGKRAWWMVQVIGAADPGVWSEVTGMPPADVLAAIKDDDYFKDAVSGLVQATSTSGDRAWALALAQVCAPEEKLWTLFGPVWPALAAPDSEALIISLAKSDRFAKLARWTLAAQSRHGYSAAASKSIAAALAGEGKLKQNDSWQLWAAADSLSRLLHPGACDDFEAALAAAMGGPEEFTDSIRKSIDRLRLRAEMHKEFAS